MSKKSKGTATDTAADPAKSPRSEKKGGFLSFLGLGGSKNTDATATATETAGDSATTTATAEPKTQKQLRKEAEAAKKEARKKANEEKKAAADAKKAKSDADKKEKEAAKLAEKSKKDLDAVKAAEEAARAAKGAADKAATDAEAAKKAAEAAEAEKARLKEAAKAGVEAPAAAASKKAHRGKRGAAQPAAAAPADTKAKDEKAKDEKKADQKPATPDSRIREALSALSKEIGRYEKSIDPEALPKGKPLFDALKAAHTQANDNIDAALKLAKSADDYTAIEKGDAYKLVLNTTKLVNELRKAQGEQAKSLEAIQAFEKDNVNKFGVMDWVKAIAGLIVAAAVGFALGAGICYVAGLAANSYAGGALLGVGSVAGAGLFARRTLTDTPVQGAARQVGKTGSTLFAPKAPAADAPAAAPEAPAAAPAPRAA